MRAEPPPARLLDLSRTVSRAGRRPTGVDRVERAYLEYLSRADDAPLWGLVRTGAGFLLLDPGSVAAIRDRLDGPGWDVPGLAARLMRRGDPDRAGAEDTVRRRAVGRVLPGGLGRLLRRHLPLGTRYVNVGHTALSDRLLAGLTEAEARIAMMIHDTIPLDWPDHQRPGTPDRFAHLLHRAERHADLLIANSKATADDIAGHLDTPPDTVVAHLGIDPPRPGTAPSGPWSDRPYLVTVGTIEPRKNHAFLLDLWEEMGADAPPLLILGARGWENHATFARLDAGPPGIHELNGLDDGALFALVAGSAGLLFPSLAEGYGLPLLEAAALGVPVVCSDLPVFREIATGFPIYAPLSEHYLWTKAIRRLIAEAAAPGTGAPGQRTGITPPSWRAHFDTVLARI
ncbi:Glycosyl transferases group 1 [Roseivivax marinus]|uniref:glycosyltransferase family 4 protein n=1 Tax=Roseivivax marinus TaxID=1379903 RepID=UPI0008C9FC7E|nr:glycosyltransferase family 1 protein [Roseivivax marinus]SEK25231.1 Glycosyl transferases group 1 [Roseivivax marinus]